MNIKMLVLAGSFVSTQALAEIQFFKGVQSLGIAGDTTDCYLETTQLKNTQSFQIRTLVADPHEGELIGLGPVQAAYQSQNQSYQFQAQDSHDKLQNLIFNIQNRSLILTILDESHEDLIECSNLNLATNTELEELQELFEHFDDFTGDHDHDDDHDHHDH